MTTRRTPSTEGEVVPLSLTDGRLSFCQFTLGESRMVRNNRSLTVEGLLRTEQKGFRGCADSKMVPKRVPGSSHYDKIFL